MVVQSLFFRSTFPFVLDVPPPPLPPWVSAEASIVVVDVQGMKSSREPALRALEARLKPSGSSAMSPIGE